MADTRIDIALRSRDRASRPIRQALRGVNRSLETTRRLVGGLQVAFAGLITAGFVTATKRAIEFADQIGKVADKVGVSTDALQELRFAAERSGVSQATLDRSLERFTKRLGEAQTGSQAMAKAFDRINVRIEDVNRGARRSEEVFNDVIRRLAGMTDATEKAATAAALFGREGVAIVNIARDGVAGYEALRQQARDLGLVLEERLIRNAEKANDSLDTLTAVIKTRLIAAVVEFAPQIDAIAQGLTTWVTTDLSDWVRELKSDLDLLLPILETMATVLRAVVNAQLDIWRFFGRGVGAVTGLVSGQTLPQLPPTVGPASTQADPVTLRTFTRTLQASQLSNPFMDRFTGAPAEEIQANLNAWVQTLAEFPMVINDITRAQTELFDDVAERYPEMRSVWQQWADDTRLTWERANLAAIRAIDQTVNAFGRAFAEAILTAQTFSEAFLDVLRDMAAQAIQILSRIAIGGVFTAFGFPTVGSALSFGIFHGGGVIAPATLPTAHQGMNLAPDETIIKAQSGERVLSRAQNRRLERMMDAFESGALTGGGGDVYFDGARVGRWLRRASREGGLGWRIAEAT